jgi:hypothetical protein
MIDEAAGGMPRRWFTNLSEADVPARNRMRRGNVDSLATKNNSLAIAFSSNRSTT